MSVHPDELTGNEQAVLLVLMAECRPVPNPELKDLGPELTKDQRDKLLRKDLIEVRPGRPMVIELADKGWRMCRAIIGTDAPAGVTGQKRALYTVLKALDRHLADDDLALADVIRPAGSPQAPASTPPSPPPPSAHADGTGGRVRDAYSRLATRPGGWVRLADLRNALADVARADVDAALRDLLRAREASLIPEENQKAITGADDAAAILIGGEKNHLMAIQA